MQCWWVERSFPEYMQDTVRPSVDLAVPGGCQGVEAVLECWAGASGRLPMLTNAAQAALWHTAALGPASLCSCCGNTNQAAPSGAHV